MRRHTWILVVLLIPFVAGASGQTNQAPIAGFTAEPDAPKLMEPVFFNSTSTDVDGVILNWTWTFDDGSRSYGPKAQRVYDVYGSYVVNLRVTDDAGESAQTGIVVEFRPPMPAKPAEEQGLLPSWMFWVMPMIVSVVLLGIAYMVVSKGQPAIYNLVFFFFYTDSGVKSLTEAVAVITAGDPTGAGHTAALAVNRLASYILAPMFLWLVLVFPRPVHPWVVRGRNGSVALLLALPFLANEVLGFWSEGARIGVFNVFSSLIAVACMGLLVYHGADIDSDEERRRIRFLSVTFGVLVVSTLVISSLEIVQNAYVRAGDLATADLYVEVTGVVALVLSPLAEIFGALVLLYAILRYQLMGIEQLVVRVTRTGLLAIVVPSMFVAVAATVEQLFQKTVLAGVRFDFIIAAFASALLMAPVQKYSTFLVYRIFPGLAITGEQAESNRRMEIFEAQLRYSLLDGALNTKEQDLLNRLTRTIDMRRDEFHRVVSRFEGYGLGELQPPKARPATT